MITHSEIKCNTNTNNKSDISDINSTHELLFDLNSYSEYMKNHFQIHQVTCPSCGETGYMIGHGHYTRYYHSLEGIVPINIIRVRCTNTLAHGEICGKTHAILPESIIPYSRVLRDIQIEILELAQSDQLESNELEDILVNYSIDYFHVLRIIKIFKQFWLARLKSISLLLTDTLLTYQCLLHYKKQFLQIKCTPNIYFSPPT